MDETARVKRNCRACGKAAGVPLIYGFPSEDLFLAERAGEVRLGGCDLPPESPLPNVACIACGHEYFDPTQAETD